MKRSAPLKRSPWPRRRDMPVLQALDESRKVFAPAQVHKSTSRAVMVRCDVPAVAIPKDNPLKSEAYRRLVALYPCKACGIAGYSQAAHINRGAKGLGLKADDRDTAPLCADRPGVVGCHTRFDRYELFPADIAERVMQAWIADTQRQIEAAGLWPANLPKRSES